MGAVVDAVVDAVAAVAEVGAEALHKSLGHSDTSKAGIFTPMVRWKCCHHSILKEPTKKHKER